MDNTYIAFKPLFLSCQLQLAINKAEMNALCENSTFKLMALLQRSMDPEMLLNIFYSEISNNIPVCGLTLYSNNQVVTLPRNIQGCYSVNLELVCEDYSLGLLKVDLKDNITNQQKINVNVLSQLLVFPLRNALEHQKVKKLALTDKLTGIANRNQFSISFPKTVKRTLQQGTGFSLLLIDLDGFKNVNDKFGHKAGDLVLGTFANMLSTCIRDCDQVFRYGGDEFTILLNDNETMTVTQFAERIQHAITKDALLSQFNISCSIGSGNFQNNDNLDRLFERADNALYRAKKKGKNCLELS